MLFSLTYLATWFVCCLNENSLLYSKKCVLKAFLHHFNYVLLFVIISAENILIYSYLLDVFITHWSQLLYFDVGKDNVLWILIL